MNLTFVVGLVGSIVLVIGAALPDPHAKQSIHSPKDWCFTIVLGKTFQVL
jgi:hypothetical protein